MQCVPHSESMQSIRRTRTPPSPTPTPGLHNAVSAVGAEFVSPGREAWENSFKKGRGPDAGTRDIPIARILCIVCSAPKIDATLFRPKCKRNCGPTFAGSRTTSKYPYSLLAAQTIMFICSSRFRRRYLCPKQLARSSQIHHVGSASTGLRSRGRRATEHSALGASQLQMLKNYIRNQEKHHQKTDFEEEFIALLKLYGVSFDPVTFTGECRPSGPHFPRFRLPRPDGLGLRMTRLRR